MFMKKESILESVSKTIKENTYVEIHPNLLLKKYQQRILDDYQIPYQECHDLKELLFLLHDYQDEELLIIADELAEMDYYMR